MENDVKRDESHDNEPLPMKKYQFDVVCKFNLEAESKPDAIIIAVEKLEGIEITTTSLLIVKKRLKNAVKVVLLVQN